jgi:hypothetical protein
MMTQAKPVQVIVAQYPEFKDYPGNKIDTGGMHIVFD